jgi:hypothetical protein
VVASAVAGAPAAHAQAPFRPQLIARDGFGDAANSYAWSMAWFKGHLYVGTARSAMCVEGATFAHYLPYAGYYREDPAPGVTCPPSIHEADLRAEIWRYAPRTGRWALVHRSPTVPNPRASGRRIARDIGYRGMAVLRGRDGRAALYVGTLTAGEYVPELARRHPPRLLRSTDGATFRAVRGGPGVIQVAEGPRRPVGFRSLEVVDGELYVTASPGLTGNGVVMRVRDPDGRAPGFRQVSPPELSVFELQRFDGALYAGSGDGAAGYGVWRMRAGRRPSWRQVVGEGAGRGATITSVVSMAAYRGRLYVGASGWGTAPDGGWEVVAGNPRRAADGSERRPVSGLPDGFGNAFNSHFWRMETSGGALLLGTNDWSWSVRAAPDVLEQLRPGLGFDLYVTCDGASWSVLSRDGLGRGGQDFGVRTMTSTRTGLYIGTTNHRHGLAVHRSRADLCTGGARRERAAARPAARVPHGHDATRPAVRAPRCLPPADVLARAATGRERVCIEEK